MPQRTASSNERLQGDESLDPVRKRSDIVVVAAGNVAAVALSESLAQLKVMPSVVTVAAGSLTGNQLVRGA